MIAVVIILALMKIFEVDFAAVKNRFIDENGKFTLVQTTDSQAYPFTLDSSSNVIVQPMGDKLNVMTASSCTVLNPTDADVVYTFTHGYANPIIRYAGNYFCTIDQGANRLRLDKTGENVYETNTENAVLTADVSKGGNVIYASRTDSGRSRIMVVNASLKKLTDFEVKEGYVVAVAIDNSGRKCAYATVDSKNAQSVVTVHTFNIGDKKEKAQHDFVNTQIADLRYTASADLYCVFNNQVAVMKSQKRVKETFKTGTVNTVCYNYTRDGELVYVYSEYSDANENFVAHINTSAKVKNTIALKQKPKYVSCASNEVCVLFADKAVTYSLTKGDIKNTYPCDDSVTSVNKLSTKLFIARSQQIDILNKQDEKKD